MDDLAQRMIEAGARALKAKMEDWHGAGPADSEAAIYAEVVIRAALTLAEPAVREACAIIAERASTCRVKTETGWKTKPDAVAERCAAAIRAGKVTL